MLAAENLKLTAAAEHKEDTGMIHNLSSSVAVGCFLVCMVVSICGTLDTVVG